MNANLRDSVTGELALVTGGSGFIGRVLCAALRERGWRVRVMARHYSEGPWDECIIKDMASSEFVADDLMRDVAVVFHLAARVHAVSARNSDDHLYQQINVQATERLVDAAVSASVQGFVFFSSVKAMGEGSATVQNEQALATPVTPYGRSKLQAEKIVLARARDSLHASVLRLPLVYGPGMGGNLQRLLKVVRSGWMPHLLVPDNARSMVDVRDVAQAAYLLAMQTQARDRVFLVTDGEDYSTERILTAMRRLSGQLSPHWSLPWWCLRAAAWMGDRFKQCFGRRLPMDANALQALAGSARYDSSCIKNEIGLRCLWTFESALKDLDVNAGPAAQ